MFFLVNYGREFGTSDDILDVHTIHPRGEIYILDSEDLVIEPISWGTLRANDVAIDNAIHISNASLVLSRFAFGKSDIIECPKYKLQLSTNKVWFWKGGRGIRLVVHEDIMYCNNFPLFRCEGLTARLRDIDNSKQMGILYCFECQGYLVIRCNANGKVPVYFTIISDMKGSIKDFHVCNKSVPIFNTGVEDLALRAKIEMTVGGLY